MFSLGNSADVFLLLRASDLGLSTSQVVAAYALFNLIYSGLSFPLGHLSDRVGKRRVLAGGLLVFAARLRRLRPGRRRSVRCGR